MFSFLAVSLLASSALATRAFHGVFRFGSVGSLASFAFGIAFRFDAAFSALGRVSVEGVSALVLSHGALWCMRGFLSLSSTPMLSSLCSLVSSSSSTPPLSPLLFLSFFPPARHVFQKRILTSLCVLRIVPLPRPAVQVPVHPDAEEAEGVLLVGV